MVVSRDIHINFPPSTYGSGGNPLITRSGSLKTENSIGTEDDQGRWPKENSEFVVRADNYDNMFMEDVRHIRYLLFPTNWNKRSYLRYPFTLEKVWCELALQITSRAL
jgi:hypothetical protein